MSAQTSPPRENLIRAVRPGIKLRAASENEPDAGPVMVINFVRFNEWTEIDSLWEGRLMERFAAGSTKKTFREHTPKVLFQHGMDPQIGDKPLGPAEDVREEDDGAYSDVPLLDAAYVRDDVLPGIRAGLYGASFRFRVIREEINDDPEASDDNPHALPERTVKEAQIMEFGPVTFPAYEGTSVGTRSLTDDFIMRCFSRDPERLRAMFDNATNLRETTPDQEDAPSSTDAAPERTSEPERRVTTARKGGTFTLNHKEEPKWRLP